jgi:pimeloyl-ACP methyl ester carboxylesterase
MRNTVLPADPFARSATKRALMSLIAYRTRRAVLPVALFGMLSISLAADAADVVIMPDGFVLQGRWFRETELMADPGTGAIRVAKAGGFNVIDDGPRYVVFSRHAQKGGKLEEGIVRPDYATYKTVAGRPTNTKGAPLGSLDKIGDFDAKWRRMLEFKIPPNPRTPGGGFERVQQQVVHLDPHYTIMVATTHIWHCGFLTAELDPKLVLKLLRTHPDLADPDGKVDPMRRMKIAEFFKDIAALANVRRATDDWLVIARQELDQLRKDAPGKWDREADERYDALREEIDRVETRIVVDNVEMAVASGRYDAARQFLATFTPKAIDRKETDRLATLRATIETVQPRYELTGRLLSELIDQVSGQSQLRAFAAAAGGPGVMLGPRPTVAPETRKLLDAAETVLVELHPDTAPRLEIFRLLADQADQRRKAGKDPGEKPTELLAYAVTGWLKGKNAAEKSVPAAIKAWDTRQMILTYLREPIGNDRKAILDSYLQSGQPLSPEELAQLITFLPPPFPEDLVNPTGERVSVADAGIEGVWKRNTGPLPGLPGGVNYYLRLPPEYHHGRAYPLLIVLTDPQMPAERLVGFLAQFTDRHGYVLAAPVWTNQFNVKPYDYSGDEHALVTSTLRDLLRKYQVDADKVFLYGFGDGANFSLDTGMSHPDLFAGLVLHGANPPTTIFREYWRNAQKLPVYAVIGELSGAFPNLRVPFEKWTINGFPALLTVYKGRGTELFPLEMPRMIDWMGRKSRVRGAASLRLNQPGFEPWQVLRESDDRFYWVGVAEGGLRGGDRVNGWQTRAVTPAQFRADIGRNGVINIDSARGITKFNIWLERDLIDWSKPVVVNVNGRRALEYVPKKLEPDLHLMFEELYRTGDRKMLYLGKLEIKGDG